MKICLASYEYPPETFDGIGTYTRTLAKALVSLGNDVYVVTFTSKKPYEYMENGVHVYRINPVKLRAVWRFDSIFPSKTLGYSIAVTRKIKELIQEKGVDIIEGPEARAEMLHYFLSRNGNKVPPVVVKLHTPTYIVQKHNFRSLKAYQKVLTFMEIQSIRKADSLTSPSRSMKECVSADLRISRGKIKVVPNPIDVDEFVPAAREQNNDAIKILYVGRIERIKGVEILMQAIPLVLREIKNCQFTFVGEDSRTTDQQTSMSDFLKEYCAAHGCADRVSFLGHQEKEDIIKFYQENDIVVIPSFFESLAYVCLEALACEKAVIASPSGGLKELITDQVNGLMFTPKDHRELAEKIIYLCKNKELRRQFGKEGRRFVMNNYSIKAAAIKTVEHYQSVLEKANHGS